MALGVQQSSHMSFSPLFLSSNQSWQQLSHYGRLVTVSQFQTLSAVFILCHGHITIVYSEYIYSLCYFNVCSITSIRPQTAHEATSQATLAIAFVTSKSKYRYTGFMCPFYTLSMCPFKGSSTTISFFMCL